MREYFPAAYIGRGRLVEDTDIALASGHINAVILRVVIQIIGIGDAGQSGYHLTRVCIQHDEAGRGFGTDEQSVISLVGAGFTIDDIDLLQVRQVHKDALARRLQLEGFWMRIELVVFLKRWFVRGSIAAIPASRRLPWPT
jgi:hypothetical protein